MKTAWYKKTVLTSLLNAVRPIERTTGRKTFSSLYTYAMINDKYRDMLLYFT